MKVCLLVLWCSIILTLTLVPVSAADVVYLTKNKLMVQKNIIKTFEDKGLTVEILEDRHIDHHDFSDTRIIFIGEGILKNIEKLPQDVPMIISNHYYGRYFGLLSRGNLLKVASNAQLKASIDSEVVGLYTNGLMNPSDPDVEFYYIPKKFMSDNYKSVGDVVVGSSHREGSVIAYSKEGNRCFWGIDKSIFWSESSKKLFDDCIQFVLSSQKHDVMIDTALTNSVNGIRIKDDLTDQFLTNQTTELHCNKKYVVDFRTVNVGSFSEDVSLHGVISNFSWNAIRKDLQPGKTTTSGSKTITVNFPIGMYNLTVSTMINSSDVNLLDNVRTRTVTVVC